MLNIKFKIQNNQRGISLYLGLIMMAIFLAIALGLTTLLIGQLGIVKGMGDSVVAFYAADTGIEKILTMRADPSFPPPDPLEMSLPNGASSTTTVTAAGVGDCTASTYCLKSIGSFRNTKRAIEITY